MRKKQRQREQDQRDMNMSVIEGKGEIMEAVHWGKRLVSHDSSS